MIRKGRWQWGLTGSFVCRARNFKKWFGEKIAVFSEIVATIRASTKHAKEEETTLPSSPVKERRDPNARNNNNNVRNESGAQNFNVQNLSACVAEISESSLMKEWKFERIELLDYVSAIFCSI